VASLDNKQIKNFNLKINCFLVTNKELFFVGGPGEWRDEINSNATIYSPVYLLV